jgi:MCM N-terminal domain/MCM OB domain
MADNDSGTITVDFEHLNNFDANLAEVITEHYYRVDPYLRKALQNVTAKYRPEALEVQDGLPREFWVSFVNLPTSKKLRDLTTSCLGKLVCFIGTVTRTSEVRPELYLGTFRCMSCSTVVRGVEQHFKYSPPLICPSANCGNRYSANNFHFPFDSAHISSAFGKLWKQVFCQKCSCFPFDSALRPTKETCFLSSVQVPLSTLPFGQLWKHVFCQRRSGLFLKNPAQCMPLCAHARI